MTTHKDVEMFCEALQRAVPLLTQWAPDGWIDFRSGTPTTLRCGLMVKWATCDDVLVRGSFVCMPATKPRPLAVPIEFRAMFGGEITAHAVVDRLGDLVPAAAWTGFPKIKPPGTDENSTLWTIEFSIAPELLEELAAIVSPAPARDWR